VSPVEAEARRLLRWFPASWRRAHAEALIGTLLDAADAEQRDRLTGVERRDLVLSGLRERGLALVPLPVREAAASIALGVGAGLATLQLGLEWAPGVPKPAWYGDYGFGPFVSAGAVVDLLWLAALVLGLVRQRVAMIVVLAVSVVAGLALVVLPSSPWTASRPPAYGLLVMALLAMTACIAPLRTRHLVVLAAASSGILLAVGLWGGLQAGGFLGTRLFFWRLDPYFVGMIVADAALLLLCARQRVLAPAVLLACGPAWLVLEVRWAVLHDVTTGAVQLVAAAAVLAIVATRSRLPSRRRPVSQPR